MMLFQPPIDLPRPPDAPTAPVERSMTYVVKRDGQAAGTGTITQVVSPDGKTVTLRLEMAMQARTIVSVVESKFDVKGAPISKVQRVAERGQKPLMTKTVTFLADRVTINSTTNTGENKTYDVALPANGLPANSAENWFCRVKPPKMARTYALVFSLVDDQWKGNESWYWGEEPLKGQTRHKITVRQGDRKILTWVDDDGLPVRVEDPKGYVLEAVTE